jgi:hypothetical protein
MDGDCDIPPSFGINQIRPNDGTTGLVTSELSDRHDSDRFNAMSRKEANSPLADFTSATGVAFAQPTWGKRSV